MGEPELPRAQAHRRGLSTARRDHAAAAGAAAALSSLALYLCTTSPFVWHEDAAEFQTLARTGGIAHAGYPLVILLLQLFGRLPVSTVAFRANLFSCVSGAAAAGLAAYGAARLCGRAWIAVVAGLSLALSLALWRASTLAGVHAFSLALGGALFLLAQGFARRPARATAFLLGLVGGAALVSHLTVLALIPTLGIAIVRARRTGALRAAHGALALVGLAIGLSPILYLLDQDRPGRPMNYIDYTLAPGAEPYFRAGEIPHDRLRRAAWLLSARQLDARTHFHPFQRVRSRLAYWAVDVGVNELPLAGLALASLGAVILWRRRDPEGLLLATWLAGTLFWMLAGADFPSIAIFFLPGLWALSQLVAVGLAALERTAWRAVFALLVLVAPWARLAVPEPLGPLARSGSVAAAWAEWPRSWNPLDRDPSWEIYGRGVMAAVPPRALVLSCWSEGTTLRYLRFAEGVRPDVEVRMTCSHAERVASARAQARVDGRALFCTFDPVARMSAPPPSERAGAWERAALWRLAPP